MEQYEVAIIGAGITGLHTGLFCTKKRKKALLIESDSQPFGRATFANQARTHMGYHYPRSISTAKKAGNYFDKFYNDFGFCINSDFEKIYAIAKKNSWTSGRQFKKFCSAIDIPCKEIERANIFNKDSIESAFLTKEFTYDAGLLKSYYLEKIGEKDFVDITCGEKIHDINQIEEFYKIELSSGRSILCKCIVNATYSSVNQILFIAGYEPFDIKYELCEIILCRVDEKLKKYGITVMDGPFFSLMPFGKTNYHSLTSVTFTPHMVSHESIPRFNCQQLSGGKCSQKFLYNCNDCVAKPKTAFPYMKRLAMKYLKSDFEISYEKSLFSMKPILEKSEIDDSRPAFIKIDHENPTFISVLSGKVTTIYDLEEILENEFKKG